MPVAAIDFGGTNIKLGIIDTGGKVLLTSVLKAIADKSISIGLEQAGAHVHALLKEHNIPVSSLQA